MILSSQLIYGTGKAYYSSIFFRFFISQQTMSVLVVRTSYVNTQTEFALFLKVFYESSAVSDSLCNYRPFRVKNRWIKNGIMTR